MYLKYSKQWEVENSTLYKQNLIQKLIARNLTYEQCRTFSQLDIANNLTKTDFTKPILEINENEKFCFLGRVDTWYNTAYDVESYYEAFNSREFVAFSTITNENISHYENKDVNNLMLAYNVPAEAIVHVFPCDSNTNYYAKKEAQLTQFPSLWWSLEELNEYTKKLKTYNQVTCRTKINGEILKPYALIVFNELTDTAKEIAQQFKINIILIHTKQNIVNYNKDLMKDKLELNRISKTIYEELDIDYFHFRYEDFF